RAAEKVRHEWSKLESAGKATGHSAGGGIALPDGITGNSPSALCRAARRRFPPRAMNVSFLLDAVVLLGYFGAIIAVGLSQRSKSGSVEGFALGDRQI